MTEVILFLIIISLLVFIVYRDKQSEKHIKELEDRIMASNLPEYKNFRGDKPKITGNPIAKEEPNEIMLGEIPFMEIPKDFKIEHEGSPETPAEAVARKGAD